MNQKSIDTKVLDDLNYTYKLAIMLIKLGFKTAETLYLDVDFIFDKDFCGECELHKDYCECNQVNNRYMAEYDDGADYED